MQVKRQATSGFNVALSPEIVIFQKESKKVKNNPSKMKTE
jgi:hypothetical protein